MSKAPVLRLQGFGSLGAARGSASREQTGEEPQQQEPVLAFQPQTSEIWAEKSDLRAPGRQGLCLGSFLGGGGEELPGKVWKFEGETKH